MSEETGGMGYVYNLARQRIAALEKVLKEIEWASNGFCPGCGKRKIDGEKHSKNCPIWKALK